MLGGEQGGFFFPSHAMIWPWPGWIPGVPVLGRTLGGTCSIPCSAWGGPGWDTGYTVAGVSLKPGLILLWQLWWGLHTP